ncbi:MAG: ABC transporter ATP-binding protein [Sedimentisphaerales bacterium]|nr:ABC transporter ATP-binding protein [Sedimentisphaerales bacterium]
MVQDLTKRFGNAIVLDRISLAIAPGKTTVIIGPSGCGKTVLLKHLIVLLRPTAGRVFFKGQRIDDLDERGLQQVRTHFGFLFQGGALFDSMTVAENILFPVLKHTNETDGHKLRVLVKEKLAMVGLDGFQDYYPANLSGGQRKRVALARAIALNPEVILYDEPTTGLDPVRADVINELILKFRTELGVTSVVVTHDMNSAYKVADRILVLHNGRIIADGTAEQIKTHPHPFVQQFINGRADQEDLAVLRLGLRPDLSQFYPSDFEPNGPGQH